MMEMLHTRTINSLGVRTARIPVVPSVESIKRKSLMEFSSDPRFCGIDVQQLTKHYTHPLRLVILCDHEESGLMLAAYLHSHRAAQCQTSAAKELLIVPPTALMRSEKLKTPLKAEPSLLETEESEFPIAISSPNGAILTQEVEEELVLLLENNTTKKDIFLLLSPAQMESQKVDRLVFRYDFEVCQVSPLTDESFVTFLCNYLNRLGVTLADGLSPERVIAEIRLWCGDRFSLSDVARAVDRAVQTNCSNVLTMEHLLPSHTHMKGDALQQLHQMIGLQDVKRQIQRVIATVQLEKRRGKQKRPLCRNLTFAGSPGTGKSETARLYAQALRECGCSSGIFREVGRESLVGQYVGETSLKVEKLFNEVRGGVLFIDEAGALVSDGRDTFGKEAIDALVRHMEISPETVVIFATYPDEMDKLLSSNDGLRSRFSRNFIFPDYSEEELFEILQNIAGRDGYEIPMDAHDVCTDFFAKMKLQKGKDFGNGREARRLLESAIEELAVRSMEDPSIKLELTVQDLKNASKNLLPSTPVTPKRQIGFCVN